MQSFLSEYLQSVLGCNLRFRTQRWSTDYPLMNDETEARAGEAIIQGGVEGKFFG